EPSDADAVAARVVDAMRAPITVSLPSPADAALPATEVFVGASVGIVVSEAGDAAEALIRNADVAMYAAKARGKGQAARYEREMHDDALARLRLEADLRAAVAELPNAGAPAGFHVAYQ